MKNKESYKHKSAKEVLASWLRSEYTVKVEQEFKWDGYLLFIPDIAVYTGGQIQAFYEVYHKNDLTGKKIGWMQYFCYVNNLELLLHEVDAEWILIQCGKPDKIQKLTCNL
jgi:hypothetical protein